MDLINEFDINFIIYSKGILNDNQVVSQTYPNQEIIFINDDFQVVKIK